MNAEIVFKSINQEVILHISKFIYPVIATDRYVQQNCFLLLDVIYYLKRE